MFLEVQEFKGLCPTCHQPLLAVPVTGVTTAYTAAALAAYRGFGHLVVLMGRQWAVKCATDQHHALKPAALTPVTSTGARRTK